MPSDRSTTVVYAALVGNALVAVSKFGAAAVSGSSAMLTEAVHSTADIANQILLLIGTKRSRAAPDDTHAFGYGGESYFWAFVVAVMVLIAGGATSLYQGVQRLSHPEPITSPLLTIIVLILSAVFEGASLRFGIREYKRVVARHSRPGRRVGLLKFIDLSKDPNLYETLLEDLAALIGIGIAAIGVILSFAFGLLWADGAASIAIGALLIADSWMIASATRSLVAGESASQGLIDDLKRALNASPQLQSYSDIKTLHLGPNSILVTLVVELSAGTMTSQVAGRELDRVSDQVKAVDSRITHVSFSLR